MALRIEAAVRARVAAALASPEVQARIQARLREERAALEQKARMALADRACLCLSNRAGAVRGCLKFPKVYKWCACGAGAGDDEGCKGEGRGRKRNDSHAEVGAPQVRCAPRARRRAPTRPGARRAQVTRQLEAEKAALLERKRQEQAERRRKQEELDRILVENRRKARAAPGPAPAPAASCRFGWPSSAARRWPPRSSRPSRAARSWPARARSWLPRSSRRSSAALLGRALMLACREYGEEWCLVQPSSVGQYGHAACCSACDVAWPTRALTARRSAGGGGAGARGGGPAAARGAAVRARPAALGLACRPHVRARERQGLHLLLQAGGLCPCADVTTACQGPDHVQRLCCLVRRGGAARRFEAAQATQKKRAMVRARPAVRSVCAKGSKKCASA